MERPFPEQKGSQYWAIYNPNCIGVVSLSFESTEVEKGSAFLPETAEEQYEELLYLFQHQGCEFSSQFSFLHLLLLSKSFTEFSSDKPWWSLEICIQMLLTWEVAGCMSQNWYFNETMNIFVPWLYLGSYFQALLWLCDGQILPITCVCSWERERAVVLLQVHDWTRYCSHSTIMLTLLLGVELKISVVHGDL